MSRNAYETLIRKPEGERQVIKGRRRWEYNIKMNHKGVECEGIYWIRLGQNRDSWN
jgi:hypothetical protein